MAANLKARQTKALTAPPDESRPVSLAPPAASPRSVAYEPSPAFLLIWAPQRYQMDADGGILPQLGKMPIEPGINGVDARGGWAIAKAMQEQRGRIVITEAMCLAEDTPDGQPGYLRATQTGSGPYHHTAWEKLEVHAGKGAIVSRDPDGYRRWLVALEERGHIPQMHDSVRRRLIDLAQAELDGASSRQGIGAERAAKLAQRQLDGLTAEAGA